VVFWLPEYAATILSARARDFWRFRSHGFEFVSEPLASPAMMEEVSQRDFLAAANLSAQGKRFRIGELEQRIQEAGSPPPQSMLRHGAAWRNELAFLEAMSGKPDRAMSIWQDSLSMHEQIGDVQGKAATLANMAGVVAQQGDVARAMALWQESLQLDEQIGDVKGKAATLANMAWAAGKQGDAKRERELNLEAARALGAVRAWLDLVTVLSNLGVSEGPDAAVFLAQALWVCAHVEAPVEHVVYLGAAFVRNLGPGADVAPLVAAYAVFVMETRGEKHPKRDELLRLALGKLGACAKARNVPPEGFREWLHAERLDDPEALVPALMQALEGLVGEHEWLFDRTLLRSAD
jgi:tetratricopeptide (TPR) repeat protein